MAQTYLTILEAAEITGKSVQTIRRAIKGKKLECKRVKTPQGFNYSITQESLEKMYKGEDRQHVSLKTAPKIKLSEAEQTSIISEYATKDDVKEQKRLLDSLIVENQKDKEAFMRFAKIFQERFTSLESQVKLLEAPGEKKKWFEFWK
jgi:hypothetical protein